MDSNFDRGSLIIIKKGNEKFGGSLASIINQPVMQIMLKQI
jgi:hypothetical protein